MVNTQLRSVVHSLRNCCAAGEHGGKADGELLAAFVARQDQTAFTALVRRHGPMVLGVCQRVLHQVEDTEDCFQATFLLLARQAVSVRKRESLGSWLHGVAYRMATNAKRAATRRRAYEACATTAPPANPAWQAAWREVQTLLDEEIQRLPASYREAFVLCCLEGKGSAEAGRELGQKEGTVWSRVARARTLLRARLARRGLSLALVMAAGALSDKSARASLPAGLLRTTVQAAAGLTPPAAAVASLVEGGMKVLFWGKVKMIVTILFFVGLIGGAAGALARPQGEHAAGEAAAQNPPVPAAKEAGDTEAAKVRVPVDRHGDALPPGALARMGTVRFRDADGIMRLAYSPDGKLLASAGLRNSIRVWDAATGREVQRLLAQDAYLCLAFCDGGKAIVTRGANREDSHLHVWDLATGKELRTIPLAESRHYIQKSPDGKTLVTAAYQGNAVYVHDPDKGTEIYKLDTGKVVGLALSSDGKTIAALGEDNVIRLWETATGKELRKLNAPVPMQNGDEARLVFSPDGKTLAAVLLDNVIRLWDVPTGKERESLKGHEGKVLAVTFAPDGKTLASGGRDQTVRLWDVASGKQLQRMTAHQSWVQSVAFSPDGRTLTSGSHDKTIRRWDVATGKEIAPVGGHDFWVFSTAFSPDGKLLATGGCDGTIRLWKADTGEEVRKIESGQSWVMTVAFSPDGKMLASGSWYDASIRLWDATTGKELAQLKGHKGSVAQVAFSPDGKILASVPGISYSADGKRLPPEEQDGAARLWDVSSGKELARLEGHEEGGNCLAFSPDGKRLVTADKHGVLRVWDVATGKERLRLHEKASSVAFSPDGRYLAVGTHVNGTTVEQLGEALQLWDASTGKKIRQFYREPRQEKRWGGLSIDGKPVALSELPGPRRVNAVAFTPDGRSLISAEHDGSVVVWEVLTGQVRREFRGHQAEVNGLALSANGRVAASASSDLTALTWDVTGLLRQRPQPKVSAERLGELWDRLKGRDSQKAAEAALALAANPEQAIEVLGKKLPAVRPVDGARLMRLVMELDDEDFDTRAAAELELGRLGRAAEPALRQALKGSPSAEQRRRIEDLLAVLSSTSDQDVAASRAVEVLEWIGSQEARHLLEELAAGASGAWLTEEAASACRRLRRELERRP